MDGKLTALLYWKSKSVFFEISENATLKELDKYIRDIWVECCGHLSRWRKEKITILSRNNPLEFVCSQCGENKAKWVDPQGFYDGNPFWCDECLHEENDDDEQDEFDEYYGPEFLLPICNSPRMGVCGYEGSTVYPDQFEPDDC